ncbi:MAG: hypothetical protein KatS3mg108_0932 [Isosphaeraceae bacterium]|jgi:autotransporter translocation and assembly factor TamB|nr:MAG: hypothetical protein KatS3mg108_0932 [Isosphaeraceae bacterium]
MHLPLPGPHIRRALKLLALLAACWLLLLNLLPRLGVRDQLAARLARQLGHPVHLGSIRLTWLGAVQLADLHVGSPQRPWLSAPEVAVDLAWLDLLQGNPAIRSIHARHVHLDLERSKTGQLNVLPQPDPPSSAPPTSDHPTDSTDSEPIRLLLSDSTVAFHDQPTQTQLNLTQLRAELLWSRSAIHLEDLSASFNGGRLALAARLEWSPHAAASGELLIENAQIDPALHALAYLIPLGDAASLATARLDLRLRLHTQANSLPDLPHALNGQGQLTIRQMEPAPHSVLALLIERLSPHSRPAPASLQGSFSLDSEGLSTRDLHLRIGNTPILLTGRTSLDGTLDYTIHAPGLAATIDRYGSRLPDRARRAIRELDLPKKIERAADLHLGGRAGAPKLSLAGPRSPGEPLLDAASLERFAERLRNREPTRR